MSKIKLIRFNPLFYDPQNHSNYLIVPSLDPSLRVIISRFKSVKNILEKRIVCINETSFEYYCSMEYEIEIDKQSVPIILNALNKNSSNKLIQNITCEFHVGDLSTTAILQTSISNFCEEANPNAHYYKITGSPTLLKVNFTEEDMQVDTQDGSVEKINRFEFMDFET